MISGAIIGFHLFFLQFKEFELYWGGFLRSVCTLSCFLRSNWSTAFGHAETGSGAKKRVVLRREMFCSNFKVERKRCSNKSSLSRK